MKSTRKASPRRGKASASKKKKKKKAKKTGRRKPIMRHSKEG